MKVDWFNVSKEHWEGRQDAILVACENMEWQEMLCSMPMGSGLAIKEAIKGFKIPMVSQVGCAHDLAPYGLLGIQAHYKNGDVKIFMVDEGCSVSPLCAFMEENHDWL